jgi:hypothetical protein
MIQSNSDSGIRRMVWESGEWLLGLFLSLWGFISEGKYRTFLKGALSHIKSINSYFTSDLVI